MQKKYYGVQALRGVGALFVVLFHVMIMVRQEFAPDSWLFLAGASGVDLFFVISGFIMVVATHESWGAAGTAWPFLKRRLIRIVPLYWIITTVKLVTLIIGGKVIVDSWHVVASYLFIPALNHDRQAMPLLPQGWTLSYEIFFYLLFAALLFLKKAPIVPLSILFIIMAILGRVLSPFEHAVFVLLDQRLLEFVLGMWIGKLTLMGRILPASIAWPLVPISLLALLLTNGLPPSIMDHYMLIIWGIPSAALVYAIVSLEGSAIWQTKLPLALGDASYAIYLVHEFVVSAVKIFIQKTHLSSDSATAAAIVLSLTGASVAGVILHHYVEQPLIYRLRRYSEGRRANKHLVQR